jgi:NADH-quinone oxidoreductase subunit J
MATALFLILATIIIGSVLGMILSRDPATSALWLVLAFAALGGLFGMLDAPFIAAVQIIIYAGAIMVLFIFVIMMIPRGETFPPHKRKTALILSVVLAAVLAAEIFFSLWTAWRGGETAGSGGLGKTAAIGRILFRDYLYPFEITSLLIMAALVGSIVLSKKRGKE